MKALAYRDYASSLRADLFAPTEAAACELVRDGLMTEQDDRWHLTLRGRLLSNDVFTNLLMGVAV